MLYINSSENEIEFSGDKADMLSLGEFFSSTEDSLKIEVPITSNQYYPQPIKNLNLELSKKSSQKLTFKIINSILEIEGGVNYMRCLGESLTNFFGGEVSYHDHFHLYYDNEDTNNILGNNNYSLIFVNQ